MSEEVALEPKDFISKTLKEMKKSKGHQHLSNRSPKVWSVVAKHIISDGLDVAQLCRETGVSRWTYYNIRKELATTDDYEAIRSKAAADAATDYEMGAELERRYMEKMLELIEKDELEIDGKGYAQINRGQSLKAERFQKFSGAATQVVEVNHVVSQEEYEDKAAELRKRIAKAKEAKSVEGDIIET
jgi:hypothetical protein